MTDGRGIPALFIVPSLRRAGAETQVVELVNGMDGRRFEKYLASFEPQLDLLDRVDSEHVRFRHYLRRHKLDVSVARRMAGLIDQSGIEIVHCTLQISLLAAWLATKLAHSRPRLVTAIHTTLNRSSKEEFYDRFLYRRLLERCDRIQFVCEAQSAHWQAKYPELAERSTVIYNGVDAQAYAPGVAMDEGKGLRERLGIASDAVVIANIAGLRPEKGHHHLLEAFAGCRGEPHLLLAGDGPMRSAIERQVATSGLDSRVHLVGEVSDVKPVLAASDASVLASTAVETFSMAMLESMAMEVPVVATDIGGLSEAIEAGETGDIVPPGDPAALGGVLQRLIDDPDKRRTMGKLARSQILARFSQQRMVAATESMLETLVPHRGTPGTGPLDPL